MMGSEKIQAYVSISYSEKEALRNELDAITATLRKFDIETFIFVDHYSFDRDQEKEMMAQSMKDIDECDFLIAEVSHKAIGLGVETGYGKAKNKPIVYLRKKEAEHSTTVSGISDFHIIYDGVSDLDQKLSNVIMAITKQTS